MSRFAYEIIYSMCCMSVARVSACDCRIRAESCQIWLNLWSTWRPNYVVRVVWKWIMDRDELIHFSIERLVEYDIVIKITFKWEAKKERSQMRKFIQEQKIIIFLHILNLHQYVNALRWIIFYFLNNNSTFVRIQCCMIWFVYGFFKFFFNSKAPLASKQSSSHNFGNANWHWLWASDTHMGSCLGKQRYH